MAGDAVVAVRLDNGEFLSLVTVVILGESPLLNRSGWDQPVQGVDV
jgi:hypothetical protein